MLDLDALLIEILDRGGSDLHLTAGLPPTMRLHGSLIHLEAPVLESQQIRGLVYGAMNEEHRGLFERRWEHDFAYSIPARGRFRVNVYLQRGSVAAAFRLIPETMRSFEELRLPVDIMEKLSARPRGFILVTGPTGSGKSTTLASMVDHINTHREEHVMTVEDPIEYLHTHKKSMVNQREVGSDTKSFNDALKYVLRQDPDVILVGEMRDLETMRAALTAAETGHLVLTTLHTQGAAQTVDRIIDAFPPHQQDQVRVQLSTSLEGIVSQQLLPLAEGGGRVVACEVLVPTPGVRNLIREGKTHQLTTAMQTGHSHGMVTMDHSLAELYKRGLITYGIACRRAFDRNVLDTLLGKS